jgi:hypothetical protein
MVVCSAERAERASAFRSRQLTYCSKFLVGNSMLLLLSPNRLQVLKFLNLLHRQWSITLSDD